MESLAKRGEVFDEAVLDIKLSRAPKTRTVAVLFDFLRAPVSLRRLVRHVHALEELHRLIHVKAASAQRACVSANERVRNGVPEVTYLHQASQVWVNRR